STTAPRVTSTAHSLVPLIRLRGWAEPRRYAASTALQPRGMTASRADRATGPTRRSRSRFGGSALTRRGRSGKRPLDLFRLGSGKAEPRPEPPEPSRPEDRLELGL